MATPQLFEVAELPVAMAITGALLVCSSILTKQPAWKLPARKDAKLF